MRTFELQFSKVAQKDLNKIGDKYKPHIFAGFFELRKEPYLGKKLKGKFNDCHSLRVGPYRVVYKVYKSKRDILVIRIGLRGNVYR